MPLSQIHYHFGSQGCAGAGAARIPEPPTDRTATERPSRRILPLWKRWEKACDYLDEDIASGYVRILQEMMAAGWSNPEVAAAVRRIIGEWNALLNRRRRGSGEAVRADRQAQARRYRDAWSATPSSAARQCCCSASRRKACRSAAHCAASAR